MSIDSSPSAVQLVARVYRKRWLVAGLCIGATAIAVIATYVISPTFRSDAKVLPSNQIGGDSRLNIPAALSGAAQQLGVSLPPSQDASSIFPRIIRSRRFGTRILEEEYQLSDGEQISLLDHLVRGGESREWRLEKGIRRLNQGVIRSHFDPKSGVTTLTVLLDDPVLAASVAEGTVAVLDGIYRDAQNIHVSRWTKFFEERLEEAKLMLFAGEDSLRSFLEQNRQISGSPLLGVEFGRLEREVKMRQEMFTTLATQYEIARVEKVKDIPELTVLDPPVVPQERFRPVRSRIAIVTAAVSLFIACLFVAVWPEVRKSWREVRS